MFLLATVILAVLKLTKVLDMPWWVVFLPLMVEGSVLILAYVWVFLVIVVMYFLYGGS